MLTPVLVGIGNLHVIALSRVRLRNTRPDVKSRCRSAILERSSTLAIERGRPPCCGGLETAQRGHLSHWAAANTFTSSKRTDGEIARWKARGACARRSTAAYAFMQQVPRTDYCAGDIPLKSGPASAHRRRNERADTPLSDERKNAPIRQTVIPHERGVGLINKEKYWRHRYRLTAIAPFPCSGCLRCGESLSHLTTRAAASPFSGTGRRLRISQPARPHRDSPGRQALQRGFPQ